MKTRRYISAILLCTVLCSCLLSPLNVSAAEQYTGLNKVQVYFTRVIGSLARQDYYKTDVLASVTLSQAVFESGWARYSLPIGGKNLFGIKAYNTWNGRVFDPNEVMLYNSYDEFLLTKGQSYINTVSAWRAHGSWGESVASHSSLFVNDSKYASVVGEKDYAKAAEKIVAAGYCSDDGYAATCIKLIKQYGFTEYDDLTPDSDGVIGIVAETEQNWLEVGDEYQVGFSAYPEDTTPSKVTWKSDNEAVATVDQNGLVKAVAHGMTLVSATLENGREACSLIYVDCNATVSDSDVYVRIEPSASSANRGKIYRGTPILVTDTTLHTDASGNGYYAVKGYNSKGELVSGFAAAECIYINLRGVAGISAVKDKITLKKGSTYNAVTAVYPADATDISISWSSSDESVASVSEGIITAVGNGNATVTAASANGQRLEISVTVAGNALTYRGIVTSHETLTVREAPDASSASVGRIPFLAEVSVDGEANGLWYKITGKTSSGKTITGYSHSAYVQIIADGAKVVTGLAEDDIKVYAERSNNSQPYGTLIKNTEYAVVGEAVDGWYFVVGIKQSGSVKAIYGYSTLTDIPVNPEPPNPGAQYYGRTTSTLHVRSGAGTDKPSIGIFAEGTQVVITGEAVGGWYRVSGRDSDGNDISGYSSAEHIVLLYNATTTAKLNVRSDASTSAEIKGVFDSGDEITVVGEKAGGWYAVEGKDYRNGNTITGFCSADYVSIKGRIEAGSTSVGLVPNVNTLVVSGGYLTGVAANTKASELIAKFDGTITVTSASGTKLTDSELVGTGCRVIALSGGTEIEKATVVVRGDVSGDGIIEAVDYSIIRRSFLGTYEIKDEYLLAALVSGMSKLTVADYTMVKRHVLGTYTL